MTNDPRHIVGDIVGEAGLPLHPDELEALVAAYPAHREVIESMYAVPLTPGEPMHLAPRPT